MPHAVPTQVQGGSEPAATPKPTFDEILDELNRLGYDPEGAGLLLQTCRDLAAKFELILEGNPLAIQEMVEHKAERRLLHRPDYVAIETIFGGPVHDALETAMPDRVRGAEAGSAADLINRGFLPDEYEFVHDFSNA